MLYTISTNLITNNLSIKKLNYKELEFYIVFKLFRGIEIPMGLNQVQTQKNHFQDIGAMFVKSNFPQQAPYKYVFNFS